MKTNALFTVLFCSAVLVPSRASNHEQMASAATYPLPLVNLATVQLPVAFVLDMVITYRGPGAWNREAPWDEYVVTICNQGNQPLTIASAALTDPAGTSHAPGADMRTLERRSVALEQKYRDAGVAFARDALPVAVTIGGGVRLVGTTGGVTGSGAGLAAVAATVPLPAYYTRKFASLSPRYFASEFEQRRLALPLTLAPGEARVGSLFFPMVPNPRSLGLRWAAGAASGELLLPLELLHGLHVKTPASVSARHSRAPRAHAPDPLVPGHLAPGTALQVKTPLKGERSSHAPDAA